VLSQLSFTLLSSIFVGYCFIDFGIRALRL